MERGRERERSGTRTALRAFKLGVKPGFISDLFTPGKQLTRGPTIPRPVSSVYFKQPGSDSFYLTNDPEHGGPLAKETVYSRLNGPARCHVGFKTRERERDGRGASHDEHGIIGDPE